MPQAPWRNQPASAKQRKHAIQITKELIDAVGNEALPKDITGGLPTRMSMRDINGLLAKMMYFPATDSQKEALTVIGAGGGVIGGFGQWLCFSSRNACFNCS